MATISHTCFVFQTDSEIVQDVYNNKDNFLIEYDNKDVGERYCAIYFSSNDIYYPNTTEMFKKKIVDKNFFEWYNLRIEKAQKHIFIRDIFKQWYLQGINAHINTPEKLVNFLREETNGYKIIISGSSAGGYAAMLYGSILGAEKVLAFNPQFEIKSLLKLSTEAINPLIFRLKNSTSYKYYDINLFLRNSKTNIYYFYSTKSLWDMDQFHSAENTTHIHRIGYSTKHHGIPFLKIALPQVINLEEEKLTHYEKGIQNPVLFTVRMVGIRKTIIGFWIQLYKAYKKRH